MIVYQSSKLDFCRDVETSAIDDIVLGRLRGALGMGAAPTQMPAWQSSLAQMHLVLVDPEIPADAGVGIEYQIPLQRDRLRERRRPS